MTCKYDNINQHDALYNAARAYPGSVEALAQRMHVAPGTLRKKLMPDVDTHHANFEEVSIIIELLEGANKVEQAFLPLHAFCWRHGHVAVRLPQADVDSDEMLKQVVEIMSSDGLLAGLVNGALGDSRINAGELGDIEEQIEYCMTALVGLRDKARAKHAADFPVVA